MMRRGACHDSLPASSVVLPSWPLTLTTLPFCSVAKPAIAVTGLRKAYGGIQALVGVDLGGKSYEAGGICIDVAQASTLDVGLTSYVPAAQGADASSNAIRALLAAGVPPERLLYYRGGIHDWMTLGLPVDGTNNWSSGYLPAVYQGTPFRASRFRSS